jgi:hypothetical protein
MGYGQNSTSKINISTAIHSSICVPFPFPFPFIYMPLIHYKVIGPRISQYNRINI